MSAPTWVPLTVALGCGLLIGAERERRKGQGDDRHAAGIRSFTIAALTGALAQAQDSALLVLLGALTVAVLAALSYAKSRSRDPGLTTELALVATYLVGVQAVRSPPLAAGCAAAMAVLLAARRSLHRAATELLSEQELHNGLILAALALVVLPLVPHAAQPWLADINPRPLAAMVILILGLQAAGQVLLRWLGPQLGCVASGFLGGFISSTATIASLGAQARRQPEAAAWLATGAALSTAATWVQMALLAAALSPSGATALAWVIAAGLIGSLLGSAGLYATAHKLASAPQAEARQDQALALRAALLIALVLAAVTWLVSWAQQTFGAMGVLSSAALAGLADAHAAVASLSALFASGQLAESDLRLGVLLSVGCNSLTRVTVAWRAGNSMFAARVGLVLGLGNALAWGAMGLRTA